MQYVSVALKPRLPFMAPGLGVGFEICFDVGIALHRKACSNLIPKT